MYLSFQKKRGRLLNAKVLKNKNALVEWNYKKGDIIHKPKSISDTLGWVIFKGNDYRAVLKKALDVSNRKLFTIKS